MMFRTEVQLSASKLQLHLRQAMISAGSCFADRMGQRMKENKFSISVNPLGIVYHPLALTGVLEDAYLMRLPRWQYSSEAGGWFSYRLHSRWNHPDPSQADAQINEAYRSTAASLHKSELLMLTLGTAYGFRLKENGLIVANCHRQPAADFERVMSRPEEIVSAIRQLIERLRQDNPGLRLLLSVSPVRHLREGFEMNSVSKSVLRLACHDLCQHLPETYYFPAYELLLDDLRDYRFYADDLIHPNAQAEQYIWERFSATHFEEHTRNALAQWARIQRDLTHRPRNADTEAHRQSLQQTLERMQSLPPEIDYRAEYEELRARIASISPSV